MPFAKGLRGDVAGPIGGEGQGTSVSQFVYGYLSSERAAEAIALPTMVQHAANDAKQQMINAS